MLAGINPLLTGALLRHLDRMGHGDVVLICDAHFPAERLVSDVIEMPGTTTPSVLQAVLTVLPLDTPVSAKLMDPAGVHAPVVDALRDALPTEAGAVGLLGRVEFYAAAREALVAVRTGETRVFGNALLWKGVVR